MGSKKIIRAYINALYFEDCYVNGVADDIDNPNVCGYNPELVAVVWDIDFTTGTIENWNGQEVKAFYKVVDNGEYVLEIDGKCFEDIEGEYVPEFLAIDDEGLGDYVYLTIGKDGKIKGWNDNVKAKVVEWFNEYGCGYYNYTWMIEDDKPYAFNAEHTRDELVKWIRNWFEKNGKGCNAVIGLSGGKDSTIVAALCAEALGADHVIGVAMPDEGQGLNDAYEIAKHLGIRFINAPIGGLTSVFKQMHYELGDDAFNWSEQSEQNIPPRLRMTMLYAIAQTVDGRVANTCNLSENYIGYETIFGDAAGSFGPLSNLTVTEVYAIGDLLGLPEKWVHKTPDDGLPNSSPDEEKFGFSYAALDKYIRGGECDDTSVRGKIDKMHKVSEFKRNLLNIPSYDPES